MSTATLIRITLKVLRKPPEKNMALLSRAGLELGPLDPESGALPLSYMPNDIRNAFLLSICM